MEQSWAVHWALDSAVDSCCEDRVDWDRSTAARSTAEVLAAADTAAGHAAAGRTEAWRLAAAGTLADRTEVVDRAWGAPDELDNVVEAGLGRIPAEEVELRR